MTASPRCGFSVVVHPEGVVISVHYAPCLEKKDGLYTLELAGDGEIKISCPSLSAAQTETPSKGVPPPTPSHNFGPARSPQPALPQVPGFPQKPEAPNEKLNQGPKDINQPQLPYYPFYPWPAQPEHVPVEKEPPIQASAAPIPNGRWGNPFYPYPYNVKPPNTKVPPAHRPEPKPLPTSSPPVVQSTKGQRKQPYYPFPFYPQPPKPETPPTQAPVTKPPPGKLGEHVIPNPFNPPPGPPQKPAEPPVSQPEKHIPFNPFPPYLQPPPSEDPQVKQPLQPLYPEIPEKTVPPKPPVSQEPQGQIYQPFYHYPFHHPFWPQGPFQTHMPPAQRTPTPAPKRQVQQSLSPLQPEASKPQVPGKLLPNKPASGRKEPSQPEAPQGQVHQYPYPYPLYPHPLYPQPEPTEKPTTVQQPPQQPGAPQGQVQQYPYPLYPHPLYPQPEPTEKPTTVQQPPQQPGAPQGKVHQYPYPLYPQPEPTEKPTTVQQPPQQPGAPQGKVHQYPYPLYPHPLYPQPEPTEKPTTVQQLPQQPGAPQGQVHQYPYPLYPHPLYPQPETTEKPTTVQQPPQQPGAPQGQVHQYPYPLYPHPLYPQPEPTEKPTTVKQPPQQPGAPQGQVHKYPYPLYPHPLYPQPEPTEKPTTVKQPPQQPGAPQGQVHQYPYPLYPQPEPTEKPTTVKQPPQQPGAPQGQVHKYPYPLYPHPLYPQPEPTEKPTTVRQPPQQPGAPQGKVHQYPYPLYPQPEPTEKPTTVQQPPQQPGAPWGQVHQPFYPFYPQPKPENQPVEKPVHKPSYQQPYKIPDAGTNGAKTATEKPVPSEKPPGVKPPDGQVYPTFNLYYPQQPQHPQPITLPPATNVQQRLMIPIAQPSNGGIFPQGPQPGSPHMPSLYCPQFCLSGFSNCCPQIAFHQHLHHIVPAGLGSKDTPPVYPALPFVPSLAYSGFGNALGTAVLPQKSTEATTMQASTSAPTSPLGNGKQPYFQPPDGNLAAPTSISKKPVNPQLPTYPYFVPNSQYPNWPYVPQSQMQNLPQSQSAADYNVLSNPQAPGNDPVNPLVQYKPYYIQPPGQQMSQLSPADMNNPSGPNLMYFTGQYQKKEHTANQQIKPRAKALQPLNMESSDSKGQMHPKVQSELDPFLIPYYMLQDAQASTYNSSQPQSFVSGSKKSTKHNQTVHPYSEPKSYLLLQHGPPGREPNSFHESPLPFRDLVDDANLQAQNLARHDSSKPQHPQNLNPPQDKHPDLKWQGKMANPLPGNVNYMPRPGDESENVPSFVSALNDPHFLDLPQDPSFSSVHLKPEFPESLKDMWKPLMPLGSNQRIPAHVPGEAFQQRSAAADYQTNGLNQAIQREAGNQKQKQVALNVNKQFKQYLSLCFFPQQ
ncbi:trithorax group protein osa-like [Seriola aureovittata]|uniref:trithorax group protein osa-like n=1 Tax=Seriola aureovittata TaxID=2871759 RepID=UPI0024BE0C36|nr:trithorax group protein osa-like [Seriola aureovittata]